MARVGRLAGAILAETRGEYFLVGHTKVPCDWTAAGFERPAQTEERWIRLAGRGELSPPILEIDIEGEPLAELLVRLFVIERTGSVSERLWRLVESSPARWLGEIPPHVWQVVRDAVLRCS
jgi:hypothetical protein